MAFEVIMGKIDFDVKCLNLSNQTICDKFQFMECNKFMSNKLAKEIKDATLAFQHVE
jgi:hypothetical protein